MFGLEDQKKKKKSETFVFDLEEEVKSDKKRLELKKKIEDRIQKIKDVLRSGEDKEEFDFFGILLHGYVSLQKVLARVPRK